MTLTQPATVSESLDTMILLDLDEATRDEDSCEWWKGCGRQAHWRVTLLAPCPHDGDSAVFCERHKRKLDRVWRRSYRERGYYAICSTCSTPATGYTWTKL